MPPQPIIDPKDFSNDVVVNSSEIDQINSQRFEMKQLDAVTYFDADALTIVGYKEVTDKEFWVRGHMPDYPLMPGVIMCEAAAQLCSIFARKIGVTSGNFIGFGGMDKVRFRGVVRPGDRLWLAGKTNKVSDRKMTFEMQGFVEGKMVFNGEFIGVPITT